MEVLTLTAVLLALCGRTEHGFQMLVVRITTLGHSDSYRTFMGLPPQKRWWAVYATALDRVVRWQGTAVPMQPREFRLLEELLRAQGKLVTRTMLLESVWKLHFDPRTNIVETHLSRLRTRLTDAGCGEAIETVRGAGYRMRDGV